MIKKLLSLDWETSGVPANGLIDISYLSGPQGIEIGAVVIEYDDKHNYELTNTFTSKIRFEGTQAGITYGVAPKLTWDTKAYDIHQLSLKDLRIERNAKVVADDYISFLDRNFGDEKVTIVAQNPWFDRYFNDQLFVLAGIMGMANPEVQIKRFNHRMIDSFTMGWTLWGVENSNELFSKVLNYERVARHSALEDAVLVGECVIKGLSIGRAAGFCYGFTPEQLPPFIPMQTES